MTEIHDDMVLLSALKLRPWFIQPKVAGANNGFKKVANAMMAQGIAW